MQNINNHPKNPFPDAASVSAQSGPNGPGDGFTRHKGLMEVLLSSKGGEGAFGEGYGGDKVKSDEGARD
jgi:hypothetical protein